MRIQSSHSLEDRGLDAYFSPPEATASLLDIESLHLPRCIWEPAAGDGAISRPLRKAGYEVLSTDIADYGAECVHAGLDYLHMKCPERIKGIVTNPPYRLAMQFAEKALSEVGYLALLLRANWLESTARLPFFRMHPPARIWISSRRLPTMHRLGWSGPKAPSNTCFAWFVWDDRVVAKRQVDWFDWREHVVVEGERAA